MGAADNKSFDADVESGKSPRKESSEHTSHDDVEYHPNQLGQLRMLSHKTQIEIAEYLGVSNRTVSAWERGTRELRADAIIKLCDFLECTPNDLLGYGEDSVLPKLDIYEEHIYTLVHGMNKEGKEIIYRITGSVAQDAQYRRDGGRKKKRSPKRNRSHE